jgi:hypothetical protein
MADLAACGEPPAHLIVGERNGSLSLGAAPIPPDAEG